MTKTAQDARSSRPEATFTIAIAAATANSAVATNRTGLRAPETCRASQTAPICTSSTMDRAHDWLNETERT